MLACKEKMRARDFREKAWAQLRGKWGVSVLVMLIYGVILSAVAATAVGPFLLAGPLMVGIIIYFLKLIRTGDEKIEDMFSGFNNFVNSLVGYLLVCLYTFLWALIPIVGIIFAIMKSYSYSMTLYLIAENPGMSGTQALEESKRIMDGNRYRLFCLHLSFIGWILLSSLTFGILLLWVMPYMQCAQAEFYQDLIASDKKEY